MKQVILGNTGISVSKIGIGSLTVGESQLNLSVKDGSQVIKYAISQGINFIDTAQYYKTYPYIKEALKDIMNIEAKRPVICSKSLAHTYSDMKYAIDEALNELDLSYIDIFLLHEVRTEENREGALRALIEAKKEGKIKAIGISTHHIDVVSRYAENSNIEVIFPLINCESLGIRKGSEAGTKEEMVAAIKKAHDRGIGIFAMKAFGGGHLTAKYIEALSYVFSLDCVDSVMIGFGRKEEVDKAIAFENGTLPSNYIPDISMKKTYIEPGVCEGCGNCIKRCPNKAIYRGEDMLAHIDESLCMTCGYCAPVCPVRGIILL